MELFLPVRRRPRSADLDAVLVFAVGFIAVYVSIL
jgi:hypothetical protein